MIPMNDIPAISIKDLTFSYDRKSKPVLKRLSLDIGKGEIVGLFGANGSGKTTLVNIICTILKRYDGSIRIDGRELKKDADHAKRQMRVLFEENIIDYEITGRSQLAFYGKMYDDSYSDDETLRLAKMMNIDGVLDARAETYSKGMRRSLELVRCLSNRPRILLLDEPTTGLDVFMRKRIWLLIKRMNRDCGTTVLLVTHDIEEARQLCDKVALMDNGAVREIVPISQLRTRLNDRFRDRGFRDRDNDPAILRGEITR